MASWGQVYAELSPEPIAAASLGQVYKGRLKTGEVVAVKVRMGVTPQGRGFACRGRSIPTAQKFHGSFYARNACC